MSDTLILLLTLPVITGFIGYVTNWAAVRMIFHPAQPVGLGPVAWQGVIYRLAPKLAGEIATTTGLVLEPSDLVARLDIDGLARRIATELPDDVDTLLRDVIDVLAPGAWASMPVETRDQVKEMLLQQVVSIGNEALDEMGGRLGDLLDMDRIVVEQLSGSNADRLARVAEEVGEQELRFIEWYGGAFGFAIGLIQVASFSFFGQWWTMPLVGALVGLGTNWLAIQMIFRPLEPTRYLGLITYQGMFPKRQAQIAADYGRIAASEIFTAANLINHVAESTHRVALASQVSERARLELARLRPLLEAIAPTGVSDDDIQIVEKVLTERLGELAATARLVLEDHLDEALGIDAIIEERLSTLDKIQFERMLRGIFEEDEIILVVIGGVLGAAVGTAQAAVVLWASAS